jgi:hypothetical protein
MWIRALKCGQKCWTMRTKWLTCMDKRWPKWKKLLN